jgi:ketosteroid isomerase-like protein
MTDSVAVVRRFYGALTGGDAPAAFALLADDVHWIEAEGFVYGGTYTGRDAVAAGVFARLASEWDGFAAVPDDVVGQDEHAVARGWYIGTFRANGRELSARFVHWFTVRDGRIATFEQVVDTRLVQACVDPPVTAS